MINLQTPYFSVVLGGEELKRHAPAHPVAAALLIEKYPLSDDEAATAFTLLAPSEACVDGELHKSISKMPIKVEALRLRMTLVRWKDDTESLVGYAIDDAVPSPKLLKAAYRNGYAARRLKVSLENQPKEHRHG